MFTSPLLAVAARSSDWSPTVAIVMIVCNVIAIAIAKYTVKIPNAEPALPSPELFGGFGLPGLLGATSFGHILGAGAILGLSSVGAL